MTPRISIRSAVARSFAALGAAIGLMLAASHAEAHASLVSAAPASSSTVAAPKQITLRFNEALAPKFSGFDLMRADGSKVAVTTQVAPKDRKTMVGVVFSPLAPGIYMVMWRAAAADDGHRTKGDFSFTVR